MLYRVCISASLQLHIAKSCWKRRTIRSEVSLFCSLVSVVLLYTLILLPNARANNMYLSQFILQSVDFMVFLLQLLLKFSISSIHLYLQQQRRVGYWSITYFWWVSCYELFLVQFRIRYWETFVRENFSRIGNFWRQKFFPSKVSCYTIMTEAENHISKNEAQHTRAILIAKSPTCKIWPSTRFLTYFWIAYVLQRSKCSSNYARSSEQQDMLVLG